MHVGYARVSTEAQDTRLQLDALAGARCERIYREIVSGSGRERPELEKFFDALRSGDTLKVVAVGQVGTQPQGRKGMISDLP